MHAVEALQIARDYPTGAPEIPLSEDGPWLSIGKRGICIRVSGDSCLYLQGAWIHPKDMNGK